MNREDGQLVLIDTPGLHRPRTLLGERLNDIVHTTWSEVDVVGLCVPANEKIGPGDRFIAAELQKIAKRTPVVGIVTKTDLVQPQQVAEQLLALQDVMEFAELIPVSAVDGFQVDKLASLLVERLPEGPQLYPGGGSNTLDVQSYQRFLSSCAADEAFTADNLIPAMDKKVGLSFLDKLIYRYLLIPVVRKQLKKQILTASPQEARQLAVLDDYASGMLTALNTDGVQPFKYAAVEAADMFDEVEASLQQLEKKGGL